MGNILIMDDNQGTGLTPYHSYQSVTKFETILSDIERNLIPVNTGRPFPVTFDEDFKNDNDDDSLFDLRPSRNQNNLF